MKTSELTGGQLDYWVARAEGVPARYVEVIEDAEGTTGCVIGDRPLTESQCVKQVLSFSTTWEQGGPIIERLSIDLIHIAAGAYFEGVQSKEEVWLARLPDQTFCERGATPLVAAMRAFVASRFGQEVPLSTVLGGQEGNG